MARSGTYNVNHLRGVGEQKWLSLLRGGNRDKDFAHPTARSRRDLRDAWEAADSNYDEQTRSIPVAKKTHRSRQRRTTSPERGGRRSRGRPSHAYKRGRSASPKCVDRAYRRRRGHSHKRVSQHSGKEKRSDRDGKRDRWGDSEFSKRRVVGKRAAAASGTANAARSNRNRGNRRRRDVTKQRKRPKKRQRQVVRDARGVIGPESRSRSAAASVTANTPRAQPVSLPPRIDGMQCRLPGVIGDI